MTVTNRKWLLLAVVTLAITGGIFLFRALTDTSIISWRDRDTGARVWLEGPSSIDHAIELKVERNGHLQSEHVIDKSQYGSFRFALYRNCLLVITGNFVIATYDIASDKIIDYYDLPFTIYEGQGVIVAGEDRGGEAMMRSGFPHKRESQ